jgi:ribosome recycling factor
MLKSVEENMEKSVQVLMDEYSEIRAGRANPALLEKITIDYYGTQTPITQLATVSVTEARTIVMQPWEASVCSKIEKAIQVSDLGINPQSDGKVIRITFPQLNEDRRRELVKEISKITENAKVAVRSVRRNFIDKQKKMKKDALISEDDLKRVEKRVQELTDRYCDEIEDLYLKKEKEIMGI